ncbi:cyclin-Q [Rhincodon typus]|uniref:cyclin-Q n=1 Tax=Rhincodon typus TaxID=259920 RepID=UPI00202ED27C|nr:cyclin-Q [Rhincodon typus]
MNRHTWERTPVAVTAWGALRDSYHGTVCLRHTPQHVAVAALYFALLCYGVEVPGDATGERAWWQVFSESVTKSIMDAIVKEIVQIYEMDARP